MPLRSSYSSDKPLDEPFHQWDLERCVYCKSHMELQHHRCYECGYPRSDEDIQMADKVLRYRQSEHGRQQYQMIRDHELAQEQSMTVFGTVGIFCCSWPMFWLIGTIIWQTGALFAWMCSLGLAIWFALARSQP